MGIREKLAYLNQIFDRYRKASRKDKKIILNEFSTVCGYNRKYAIRLLNRKSKKKQKKAGRKSKYNFPAVAKTIRAIWIGADQPCSKRLKIVLPHWLPYYEEENGALTKDDRDKVLTISPATIDRLLKPIRNKFPRKRFCTTKPGTMLKTQIPIKTNHWDVTKPGFMEADTVAHCGNAIEGDYIHSLTLTDILTTWTECRGVWCKGAEGVLEQVQSIETALPFPLKGFDSDNGSEFINHHFIRYFADEFVQFTRSRPYRKNDNAFVEQKNWTHVRHLLGYERLDDKSILPLLNNLYANEWSQYQNHFCATMKLIEKVKVNSKYKKRYDTPRTPYQRVMECQDISEEIKMKLKEKHDKLNPFKLKKCIDAKAKAIFSSVNLNCKPRKCI